VNISIYMEIVLLFSFYPLSFIHIAACELAPIAVYLLSFIRASATNSALSWLVLSSLIMRFVINAINVDIRKGKFKKNKLSQITFFL